jgi:hypothetical protein
MNTGRDSGDGGKTSENPAGKEAASVLTGEETDSTEKPEDGDQPPDVSVAETLNLSDPKL